MRNPMNSWEKSDTSFSEHGILKCDEIGKNDLKLMQSLVRAGSDHAKFLRMIHVTVDITAPLYWWKEYDTYKVGTVANSCSTMHTIHKKEFTLDDFSHERLNKKSLKYLMDLVRYLNVARDRYNADKTNKDAWWQIIQLLPTSYNQKRTVQLNYQVLLSMHRSRKHHKLDERRAFCGRMEALPYFKEVCLEGDI